jgi:hypothetical protein
MFFTKKPKPQPVDPVDEFNNAIGKAASTASDFLPAHQIAELLHEAGQRYEQVAALSCAHRPAWHPDPTPVVGPRTEGALARVIRGGPRRT